MGVTTLAARGYAHRSRTSSRLGNISLWTVQVLLAALFLFAGGFKLVMPAEALVGPVTLPTAFLRFIGACEFLGAVGLILPWATGIQRQLTPIAAAGLVIIMTGATVLTIIGGVAAGSGGASRSPVRLTGSLTGRTPISHGDLTRCDSW